MVLRAQPPLVLIAPGQPVGSLNVVVRTDGSGRERLLWQRRDFTQWTRVPAGDVVADAGQPVGSGQLLTSVQPGEVLEMLLTYNVDLDPNQVLDPADEDGRIIVPGLRSDGRSPNLATSETFPAAGTAVDWQATSAVPVVALVQAAEPAPVEDAAGLLAFPDGPNGPIGAGNSDGFSRRPFAEAVADLPGHTLHAILLLVDEQGNWSQRDHVVTLLQREVTVQHESIHVVNDGADGDSSASFFVWTLLGNRLQNRVTVPKQDISDSPDEGHETEEFIDLTQLAESRADIDPYTVEKGDAGDTAVLAVLSRGDADAFIGTNVAGNFLSGPAPGPGQPTNLFSGEIIDLHNAAFAFPAGRAVEIVDQREFIIKANPLNSEFEYDVSSSISVRYGGIGSTTDPLTVEAQFVRWTDADPTGARGVLYGSAVTLTGPMGTAFYLDSNYPGFEGADFTPPLSLTGMVEMSGGRAHQFTLAFAVPVTNPVFLLRSLGSILTLPAGTTATKLSGDDGFTVDGNVIRGAAQNTPGPDGTPRPDDSAGTAQLTGTFRTILFTLTPNYDDNGGTILDGVFLQIGAA